ncbi:MAG TPA: DUF1684 domain-containing protein [Steroidobacteraceae bacterium]|nr:DUF1684 domain-containing protein [Steroidobacteraceae bacterium]
MTRLALLVGLALAGWVTTSPAAANDELDRVRQWRNARVAELTAEDGWLTLVGLLWLDPGENSWGSAAGNHLVLDHPGLPAVAGTFFRDGQTVRFTAAAGTVITHDGQPVSSLQLHSDAEGEPTVLACGSLRFFIIERAGKLGVRVRDVDSPRRRDFKPIEYFPVDTAWVLTARFEPYVPHRSIPIVNILGLEQNMESPGAIVFRKDGREWRLDTILESPRDETLFVMLADGTSGRETYGGGRFLRVPLPERASGGGYATRVDFNEAYNPPCAFNDFATCPLPPFQNRLTLRIESGERTYGSGNGHGAHAP